MLLTVLLAKVFGLYMVIMGLAVLARRRTVLLAIAAITEDKSVRLVAGILGLLMGLFLVNVHNVWTTTPAALVSLLGWLALVKGLCYLLLKDATLDSLMKFFQNRKWFFVEGILIALVGLYLAGYGFGFIS